ncbi:PASTA domain-containing protein [Lentzea sp. NPDC054927]
MIRRTGRTRRTTLELTMAFAVRYLNRKNLQLAVGVAGALAALGACVPQQGAAPAQSSVSASVLAATTTPAAAPVQPAPAAKTCTVPNVVGMVHQYAQDTMQAAGLYVLLEQDATGRGRMLVLDRNWETTAQSVPAGEVVDCTTAITLSAKKIGE